MPTDMKDLRKAVDQAKEIYIWVTLGMNTIGDYGQPLVKTSVGGYMLTYKTQVKQLINCLNANQQSNTESKFFFEDDTLYIDGFGLTQPAIPLDFVS